MVEAIKLLSSLKIAIGQPTYRILNYVGVKMLVEFVQVKKTVSGDYVLDNVYVNPQQIVFITENKGLRRDLMEGKVKLGLNQNFTIFTDIRMNHPSFATEITVVGDPAVIEQKIFNKTQKQLLRG
jgi:hypothetical protein